MTILSSTRYNAHAPIYLHHAFHKALDAFEDWQLGDDEPSVSVNERETRISIVFRRLWNCDDFLPYDTMQALYAIQPEATQKIIAKAEDHDRKLTFGDAALLMRRIMHESNDMKTPPILHS